MEIQAKYIVQRLVKSGHAAYFAGGWVRDRLLGISSEDIDISTSATPEEVIDLFDKTVPVGKAFGVVIVVVDNLPFEVSSFRKDGLYLDGRHPISFEKATPQQDALRRDLTINGLFFDPLEEKIIDYVGGEIDLKRGIIRAIGDPEARFFEDRLRMIRAIRFAAQFGFDLDPPTSKAIKHMAHLLYPAVAKERVWQEWNKMGRLSTFGKAFSLLEEHNLLRMMFPQNLSKETIAEAANSLTLLPSTIPLPLRWASTFYRFLTDDQLVQFFEEMKVSKQEKGDLLFGLKAAHFLKNREQISNKDWVEILANPLSDKLPLLFPESKEAFIAKSEQLFAAIDRRKEKRRLLEPSRLLKEGILPGKKMGELLDEGESLAIEKGLRTEDEVLSCLKNLPIWN